MQGISESILYNEVNKYNGIYTVMLMCQCPVQHLWPRSAFLVYFYKCTSVAIYSYNLLLSISMTSREDI